MCLWFLRPGSTLEIIMNHSSTQRTIASIVAQMEAAVGLLKFSADDIEDMATRNKSIFENELRVLVESMRTHVSFVESNIAFLLHTDLFNENSDGADGSDTPSWNAQEMRANR
jgi:TusA-related sulfurtransferase